MANVVLNPGVVYYAGLWLPITDGMLIPPDSVITIEPNWINNSQGDLVGHVILSGKRPNGSPIDVNAIKNQDKTAEPGENVPVTFEDIAVDQQEGIWAFNCYLTIDGVDAGSVSFAMVVSDTITAKQVRYPLESQVSPFDIILNPTEVYDHVGSYIYRVLPLPIDMNLSFQCDGLSYVEVLDADNGRWLLDEKTEINDNANFIIHWDGRGVFEPRVWKNSHVKGISISFHIPDDQVIKPIKSKPDYSTHVLVGGLITGIGSFVIGGRKRVQ